MKSVADALGNAADAVGNIADGVENIADGVENIADGIGNQFLPSLAPERSYEISCTSLMKGIFLIFAASLLSLIHI